MEKVALVSFKPAGLFRFFQTMVKLAEEGDDGMNRVLGINEIKDTVAELGGQYGTERIYLFGSYARGEAGPGSDVDLRIDKGKIRGLFALSGLHLALEEQLGTKVDLLTSDSLDHAFLDRIRTEEVLLYANE